MIKISSGILRITSVAIILIAAVSILPADIFGGNLTLEYSTYLGGSYRDEAYGIAIDTNGNTYLAGSTFSSNFPMENPYQAAYAGSRDVFVAKMFQKITTPTPKKHQPPM